MQYVAVVPLTLTPSHPPQAHPSTEAPPPPPLPPAADPSTGEDTGDIDIPLEQLTFDPHLGVSEEGDETEI